VRNYGVQRMVKQLWMRHPDFSMFRLDTISCLLTIVSTVLVGRRMWQGWIVAGANSVVICVIGLRTTQLGFIPANLFCIAIYIHNIVQWRSPSSLHKLLDDVEHCGKT